MILYLSQCDNVIAPSWWHIDQEPSEFNRVYFIQGGKCRYTDAKNDFEFEKNCLYILPSNTRYKMRQDPDDRLNHTFFHCTVSPPIEQLIKIPVKENSLLADSIELLKNHLTNNNQETLILLGDLILNVALSGQKDLPLVESAMAKAKAYIDQNLENKITLEDLSSYVHFERSYFIRSFKKTFKYSPIQYMNEEKLKRSLTLLKKGFSVSVIVETLSFSSVPNFTRMFTNRFGISPSNYLSNLIQESNSLKKHQKEEAEIRSGKIFN